MLASPRLDTSYLRLADDSELVFWGPTWPASVVYAGVIDECMPSVLKAFPTPKRFPQVRHGVSWPLRFSVSMVKCFGNGYVFCAASALELNKFHANLYELAAGRRFNVNDGARGPASRRRQPPSTGVAFGKVCLCIFPLADWRSKQLGSSCVRVTLQPHYFPTSSSWLLMTFLFLNFSGKNN